MQKSGPCGPPAIINVLKLPKKIRKRGGVRGVVMAAMSGRRRGWEGAGDLKG